MQYIKVTDFMVRQACDAYDMHYEDGKRAEWFGMEAALKAALEVTAADLVVGRAVNNRRIPLPDSPTLGLCNKFSVARTDGSSEDGRIGWMLESVDGKGWWDGRAPWDFTHDPNGAVVFPSQSSADFRRLASFHREVKVTEHVWISGSPPAQASAVPDYEAKLWGWWAFTSPGGVVMQKDCPVEWEGRAIPLYTHPKKATIQQNGEEVKILRIKASGTLANNLCPAHRDKQVGKPCLACEIGRLEKDSLQLRALVQAMGECEKSEMYIRQASIAWLVKRAAEIIRDEK